MSIKGMNHAVLYVRSSDRHREFYEDVLDFKTIMSEEGKYAFMRAPSSDNHHDIAFFTIGDGAGPSAAGKETVGMYHVAWEVSTLSQLVEMEERLRAAGSLAGASDHGVNKSLYCKDPDGLEFEVMWLVPPHLWGDDEHQAIIRPLDLAADVGKYGALLETNE
ncbi:MAG: VOC family protein [Acidimicrobiales bacterium]